jgi:hypothetical protein
MSTIHLSSAPYTQKELKYNAIQNCHNDQGHSQRYEGVVTSKEPRFGGARIKDPCVVPDVCRGQRNMPVQNLSTMRTICLRRRWIDSFLKSCGRAWISNMPNLYDLT